MSEDRAAEAYARRLARLALALLVLGVACRVGRYALEFPVWGDESFVLVNFLDRDYLGLTKQLEHGQVAPLLFLWAEHTAYRLLGSSEWSLRLPTLLAGLAALALFWHLARLTVGSSIDGGLVVHFSFDPVYDPKARAERK